MKRERPLVCIREEASRRASRFVVVAAAFITISQEVTAQVGGLATSTPVLSAVAAWNAKAAAAAMPPNSLTLLINSGAVQTIPTITDNRVNSFPTPISITTQWQLTSVITWVDLVGYFSVPSSALSTAASHIPSSRVEGRVTTGRVASFTPFTGQPLSGTGTPGGTLHLFRQLIVAPLNGTDKRTDNLELQLNLRGIPKLQPGVYRGTLTLRALAY